MSSCSTSKTEKRKKMKKMIIESNKGGRACSPSLPSGTRGNMLGGRTLAMSINRALSQNKNKIYKKMQLPSGEVDQNLLERTKNHPKVHLHMEPVIKVTKSTKQAYMIDRKMSKMMSIQFLARKNMKAHQTSGSEFKLIWI